MLMAAEHHVGTVRIQQRPEAPHVLAGTAMQSGREQRRVPHRQCAVGVRVRCERRLEPGVLLIEAISGKVAIKADDQPPVQFAGENTLLPPHRSQSTR